MAREKPLPASEMLVSVIWGQALVAVHSVRWRCTVPSPDLFTLGSIARTKDRLLKIGYIVDRFI